MTDTVGKFTSYEDDNGRLHSVVETKATDDPGTEALKDITFGSVRRNSPLAL